MSTAPARVHARHFRFRAPRMRARWALLVVLLAPGWIPGSTSSSARAQGPDAGPTADAGTPDPGHPDTDRTDTTHPDTNPPDTNTGAGAPTWHSNGPRPKVAVVVAGDPDPGLRDAALRVDRILRQQQSLATLSDPAMRRALRGADPRSEPDGLEQARSARRRLGWSETRDLPVLASIGRRTGAAALVVVRRRESSAIEIVVTDVSARAFYEGALEIASANDAEIRRFVRTRAYAAALHTTRSPRGARAPTKATPAQQAAPARQAAPAADAAAGQSDPQSQKTAKADDDGDHADDAGGFVGWIKRNWPYVLAGAAFAGLVTWFGVREARGDAPPQPMLRFRPGGDR